MNKSELSINKSDTNQDTTGHNNVEQPSYQMKIVWPNVIGFLLLHFGAIYGFYLSLFEAKLLTTFYAFLLCYSAAIGITMGAHRLYTHRTFKANKWIRVTLMILQTISAQNCLWVWVRDHRQHHKYSDTDGDPHNATRGFFFSHMGWLMVRKNPQVFIKGKTIDMSDINAEPIVMFQKKYYKTLFFIFSLILPTIVPCLVWKETLFNSFFVSFLVRVVYVFHCTWSVNSFAHFYGMKPFTKDILPVENPMVSIFCIGEGWHNYHHAFPWDYRTAEFGQHFNLTTKLIDYCARKGWVYDLKSANLELVKNHAMNKGDGSHKIYGVNNLNKR